MVWKAKREEYGEAETVKGKDGKEVGKRGRRNWSDTYERGEGGRKGGIGPQEGGL